MTWNGNKVFFHLDVMQGHFKQALRKIRKLARNSAFSSIHIFFATHRHRPRDHLNLRQEIRGHFLFPYNQMHLDVFLCLCSGLNQMKHPRFRYAIQEEEEIENILYFSQGWRRNFPQGATIHFNQRKYCFKTHISSTSKHTPALGEVASIYPNLVLAKGVKYSS